MSDPVSPALVSVLRAGRPEFNARFAAARRLQSELDPGVFLEFLREVVGPLATAVAQRDPARVAGVVEVAYDAALELVGQRHAGRQARHPAVEEGWRRVLPAAVQAVLSDPPRVIAGVSNASIQLAQSPGVRIRRWFDTLEALAPRCPDADTFLGVGQVAAWRAGLAHYRAGALAVADRLPPELALGAVGANPLADWGEVRTRLAADRWHDPGSPVPPFPGPQVVARAGAFRGFGGLFPEPPRVVSCGDEFVVTSGGESWLLVADVFGATFHRASAAEAAAAASAGAPGRSEFPPGMRVEGTVVTVNGVPLDLSSLGPFTSVAANATTVGITARDTHAVVLVAPPRMRPS